MASTPGRMHGKVAIVTGAARGIGRSAAIAMPREGAAILGIGVAGNVAADASSSPRRREASTAPNGAPPIRRRNGV